MTAPRNLFAAVLTVSDRGAAGTAVDTSGPELASLLEGAGFTVVERSIVPDEIERIASALRYLVDFGDVDIICTTGGTGPAPRDVTPEATLQVVRRQLPGFGEAMRAASLQVTPLGMLSRSVAGIAGRTLIVNFPGSPKAVRECFAVVQPVLRHTIELIVAGQGEHVTSPGG